MRMLSFNSMGSVNYCPDPWLLKAILPGYGNYEGVLPIMLLPPDAPSCLQSSTYATKIAIDNSHRAVSASLQRVLGDDAPNYPVHR